MFEGKGPRVQEYGAGEREKLRAQLVEVRDSNCAA